MDSFLEQTTQQPPPLSRFAPLAELARGAPLRVFVWIPPCRQFLRDP